MVQLAGADQHFAQRAVQQAPESVAGRALLQSLQAVQHQQQRQRAQQGQRRLGRSAGASHHDPELLPRPLQQAVGPVLGGRVCVETPAKNPTQTGMLRMEYPVGDESGLAGAAPGGHADQGDLGVGGPAVQAGQFLRPASEMLYRLRAGYPSHRDARRGLGDRGGAGGEVDGRREAVVDQVGQQPTQRRMIAGGRRVQHQVGAVGDLGAAGQDPRVPGLGGRVPGHDRDMTRRGARVDPGAGPVVDLPQDCRDPLVGEAEPEPHQVAVHQAG